MDRIEFYLSGILLNSLCLFGLIANILTLYVLNASREMRHQPINMFLSVLAIYDKGVLLNAILHLEKSNLTAQSTIHSCTVQYFRLYCELPSPIVTNFFSVTILMCGVPALSKHQSNNNLINNNLLNNLTATTMPDLHKIVADNNLTINDLNRKTRSIKIIDSQMYDNQLWIDIINSTDDDYQFLDLDNFNNQYFEKQILNLNKSDIFLFLNSSEAMAQKIHPNWTNLDYNISTTNLNSQFNQQASFITFSYLMHRISNFFAGHIQIIYPLANISQTGSIWITCLITAERYLVVCFPLKSLYLSTRYRAFISILIVSICALLFNITRFAEVKVHYNEQTGIYEIHKSDLRDNIYYYWVYYIFLNLLFLYVIPLTLLTYLNTKIFLAIRMASKNRSSLTRCQEVELNIATMLVLVVSVFIACNAPMMMVHVMELMKAPYLQISSAISNVLVCFNSSTNFVIYSIFGKKFRAKLKEAFSCRNNSINSMHTNQLNNLTFLSINQNNLTNLNNNNTSNYSNGTNYSTSNQLSIVTPTDLPSKDDNNIDGNQFLNSKSIKPNETFV